MIVALPDENDRVRQISSEKEPHLTLLYLGSPNFNAWQIENVTAYVEHAASMLSPFVLEVDKRGTLGDKNADVLFFYKNQAKRITDFRDQLLKNNLISQAYFSTDQFDQWVPHLTLGFPETPAKKSPNGEPGIIYVSFNRIALWTGDSTGPTFQLKDNMEVAMSQLERGRSSAEDILAHHGVKGMKWGVHKAEPSGGSGGGAGSRGPRLSADAKVASTLHNKINTRGTGSLSNQELRTYLERIDLERRYQSMQTQHQSEMDQGLDAVKKVLKVGKTVEDVRKFMATPTGKAIQKGLKATFTAAKVGAAAYTGGTSGAATAAGSVVVRRLTA